jgi:2-aminoadipate transaminase
MNYAFADRTRNFTSSAVRDILAVIQQGDVISFAGGLPSEEFFPVEQVQSAYEKVFESVNGVLQYGVTGGYLPLRVFLKDRMEMKGIHSEPETILMTTGSQQAIFSCPRILLICLP